VRITTLQSIDEGVCLVPVNPLSVKKGNGPPSNNFTCFLILYSFKLVQNAYYDAQSLGSYFECLLSLINIMWILLHMLRTMAYVPQSQSIRLPYRNFFAYLQVSNPFKVNLLIRA